MEHTTSLILDATLFCKLVQPFVHPALYLAAALVPHGWMRPIYIALALIAFLKQ